MNNKILANHYHNLTPEERFRLLMAADNRNDEAERNRLTSTAKRIQLVYLEHAPYAHALQQFLLLRYIELLEDAASFLEYYAQSRTQLRESTESARKSKRGKKSTPEGKDRKGDNDTVGSPDWHRTGRLASGFGFLFNVKLQGLRLFCGWLNVSPIAMWEQMNLPGLDRLKRAFFLAYDGDGFSSVAEFVLWVNEKRPAGDPEYTEANVMTAEQLAVYFATDFREQVRWRGG